MPIISLIDNLRGYFTETEAVIGIFSSPQQIERRGQCEQQPDGGSIGSEWPNHAGGAGVHIKKSVP